MSNKFGDYTNRNLNSFADRNKHILDDFKQNNSQQYNELNEIINKYSNMSQNQIFNEFIKVAEQKKQDGTLTLEYINNIRNTLFPYLTDEQKNIFNNLVNYLR